MTRRAVLLSSMLMVIALAAGFGPAAHAADPYKIGPGDILNIAVWERPDLSRAVAVRQSGDITYPPLGDIHAAGQSSAELGRLLEQRLNDFLRTPAQVTVEVSNFNSQYITVSGAVGTPGRYSFEHIPGIVDVLGSTGGLGATGDLSNVQIFRTEDEKAISIRVDVASALRSGSFAELPALRSGDVLYVPSVAGDTGIGTNIAYVSGLVGRPGAFPVGGGMDLMQVLSLAGGTVPGADLSKVEVMGHEGTGTFIATVDLRRYLDRGVSGFTVRPGDTVLISNPKGRGVKSAWGITQQALIASRDVLNLVLIRDVARR